MSRVYSVDAVRVEWLMTIPEMPPAISVSAEGQVPTSGWSHPDLSPWVYIVPPKDGILDLDFIASPPTGLALQVFTKIGVTKAFPVPPWVVGVRVHSSTNSVEAKPEGARASSAMDPKAEGWPLPWPFPWYVPKARR